MPSQFSEDKYTLELVRKLKPPKVFLEIGCADVGKVENTCSVLADLGWMGVFCDCDTVAIRYLREYYLRQMNIRCFDQRMTVENCKEATQGIPRDLGVLAIDIDGNDYWVWEELCTGKDPLKPWVVIIEAQIQKPFDQPFIMPYNPDHVWDNVSHETGASIQSLKELGDELGYTFLGKCPDEHSPNLFFLRDDLRVEDVGLQRT